MAEVRVLTPERPVAGELLIEAADRPEQVSPHRHLTGEQVCEGQVLRIPLKPARAGLRPLPHACGEEGPGRRRVQRHVSDDDVGAPGVSSVVSAQQIGFVAGANFSAIMRATIPSTWLATPKTIPLWSASTVFLAITDRGRSNSTCRS